MKALLIAAALALGAAVPGAPPPVASHTETIQPECSARVAAGNWSADMWSGNLAHCAALWPYNDTPAAEIIVTPTKVSATPAPTTTPRR